MIKSAFAGIRNAIRSETEGWVQASPAFVDIFSGANTIAGEPVTPEGALSLDTYFACLRCLSEDVGKLPLVTYERLEPRGKRRAGEHPLYALLHSSPNPDMTAMTFRETLTHWAAGHGNGYAQIIWTGRGIQRLTPIHPTRVEILRDDSGILYYMVTGENGAKKRFSADEIFHLHGMGNGVSGYSVVRYAAETIGLGIATRNFGAAFFGNNTTLGTVFQHPKTLSDIARQHLKEDIEAERKGPRNAHKMLIAEEGMTVHKLGIPPEEAQFIATGQHSVESICRWFRMQPHKVQHLLRATYSNIEAQSLEYVTDTLMAWLVRWEQEIARKLFREDARYFAEHVVLGLLRGDQAARGDYYTKMLRAGAMSPNDIRERENDNPVEGGDTYYVTRDLIPTDAAINEVNGAEGVEQTAIAPSTSPVRNQEVLRTAYMRIFTEVISRVIRKESNAAERAVKAHKGEAVAFGAWCDKFYGDYTAQVTQALCPAVYALAELVKGSLPPDLVTTMDSFVRVYADMHVKRSGKELTEAFVADTMDECLAGWEFDRTEEIAGYLTDRVIQLADGSNQHTANEHN